MATTIRPLNEFVLIKLVEEEVIEQGVLLPENRRKEDVQVGEVIAIPDHDELFSKVKVGDKIVFDKDLTVHVKIKEDKHYFIRQTDILGIIDERP